MKENPQLAAEPKIGSEDILSSDQAKSKVSRNGSSVEPDALDPFDPENLRIDQTYLARGGTAHKLLTTIPVRKPTNQAFIRVREGEEYRLNVAIIELQEDRETFLVDPRLVDKLPETEYHFSTLYLYTTRAKTIGLWPVKLPTPDGRKNEWHLSAAEAAEHAMKRWVRVKANMESRAYEVFEATGPFPDPEWPDMTFKELLRIAFKRAYIDTLDHAVIKRLQGEI